MGDQKVVLCRFKSGNQIDEENYADTAKSIMEKREKLFCDLTTTKLRGIYSQIINVNSKITDEADFEKMKGEIQFLKVKMAYESGRELVVKEFLAKSYLMVVLDSIKTYDQFVLYCRYAESLVAYFKYFGGEE